MINKFYGNLNDNRKEMNMNNKIDNLVVLAMLILAAMPGMVSATTRTNRLMNSCRRLGRPGFRPAIVILSTLITLLIITQGAYAAQVDNGCINDVFNQYTDGTLTCTANDIQVASATNIVILDDGCAYPGDTVTFTANFEVVLTAQARHDVGIYFANDGDPNGDGALSGTCSISNLDYTSDPPWLDLDGTIDDTKTIGYCSPDGGSTFSDPIQVCNVDADCPTGNTCEDFGPGIQDTCGDIDDAHSPLLTSITLTVACVDDDGDGNLDLPYCTSWRQPGANELCLSPEAAHPGAPSKCKCEPGFEIDIPVPGQIIVDKVTLDFNGDPLPGDPTVFDFNVQGGPVGYEVDEDFTLTDNADPHAVTGLVAGTYSATETLPIPDGWELDYVDCVNSIGDTETNNNIDLQSGETVTCTFYDKESIVPPIIDVIKTPSPNSVDEPGGLVTYTVEVVNTAESDATLDSLIDDAFGDLTLAQDSTCDLTSVTLMANSGNTYSCTFTGSVSGNAGTSHENIVEATASNDAGTFSATDSATVTITDVPSDLAMTKTASPDNVDEPGGSVTYTFTVENPSLVDTVTINSLTDTIYGDLNGQGDCSVPQTILAGDS